MTKKIIKVGKKYEIRAMDIDFKNGNIYLSDYERGYFYHYSVSLPVDCDSNIDLVSSHLGSPGAKVIKYWKEREEIFVGFKGGKICVYQLDSITSGPICKFTDLINHI
jgi:hypothetical protein